MNTDMNKPDQKDARRYLFDLAFDGNAGDDSEKKESDLTFSKDELEEVKRTAYIEGIAAGKKEASSEEDARLETLLKNIDCQVSQTTHESTAFWGHQLGQMQKIALMIAKKVMPAYTQKYGLSEIETVVTKVMTEMGQEPRLVFRVPESQFDEAKKRIDATAAQAAYAGKLVILGDPELEISECRVEWADGGIERDLKKLWEDIDKVMAEVQTLDDDDTPHQTESCTEEQPVAPQPSQEPRSETQEMKPTTEIPSGDNQ